MPKGIPLKARTKFTRHEMTTDRTAIRREVKRTTGKKQHKRICIGTNTGNSGQTQKRIQEIPDKYRNEYRKFRTANEWWKK